MIPKEQLERMRRQEEYEASLRQELQRLEAIRNEYRAQSANSDALADIDRRIQAQRQAISGVPWRI